MSFSPIIRVRKLLEKMKLERSLSPRNTRKSSRGNSSDDTYNSSSSLDVSTPALERFKMFNSLDGRLVWWHGQNQFEKLPIEATMLIFSFLEAEDLMRARAVSRDWNVVADDSLIWKQLCIFDWKITKPLRQTWKKTYLYLEELFSEGIWEGMSKWIEPSGFDNEQKTTAKLHFIKRQKSGSNTPKSSPTPIHRVDSTANAIEKTFGSNFRDSTHRIIGSGVTINCAAPSPFQIEGERIVTDETGTAIQWHKHFEKHTSVYTGKIDYVSGSVSGNISYNDGYTHWKGIFYYAKSSRSSNSKQENHVMA